MAKAPDTTLCLINFNYGVYDITGQATIINNGVTLSSVQTKYNLQSGYFDYLNLNSFFPLILSIISASELGVPLKEGYNGDLTSRQAGSIGGEMVRKMIKKQEEQMSSNS